MKTMRYDSDEQRRRMPPTEQVAVLEGTHEDQYAHYSHQMPDETKEAAGRFIVRIVPLLYGVLLGGLSDHLSVGIVLGLVGSIGLDLRMGEQSLVQPLARRFWRAVCPRAALLVRALVDRLEAAGLQVPERLRSLRCGTA
jgi:hypothetical protein